MVFAVPFDGSELAEAALVRADEFGRALDESLIVLTVVSSGPEYAIRKGWIDSRDEFDVETVARQRWERARKLVPGVDFEYEVVDTRPAAGEISKAIRRMIRRVKPSVVFLGSENAGRIAVSVSSVGGSVATDRAYDVYLVRHRNPV